LGANPRGGTPDLLHSWRRHDGSHHLGVVDDVFQLGFTPVGIQRHHRCAQGVEGQPMEKHGRPILEHQPDAMPRAQPSRRVSLG
jgi:hypothetical protein